jgi:hypothetical protein
VNPDLQTIQNQRSESDDGPCDPHVEDAHEVLTRVLYESLSGRVSDDLQWALG